MVDESDDKYESQEEGEYHFSDDQLNYDVEPELPKAAPVGTISSKGNLLEKLTANRRALIVTSLLVALVFVVYKMLMPTTSSQPTEFDPTPAPAQTAVAKQPQLQQPQQPVQAIAAPAPLPVAQNQTPAIAPLPVQRPQVPAFTTTATPPEAPVGPPSGVTEMPSAPITAPGAGPNPIIQSTMPAPLPGDTSPAMNAQGNMQNKSVMERLAVLEEQNAKLVGLLQTQYAQKIVDYEAQNNATQERLHAVNKRLANMEASLNHMAQLLQGGGGRMQQAPMTQTMASPPLPKTVEPKMTFTVQAIIPGRAWLKSDSGDTVTVAEGDVLKDYGRITKIDPYDGIVDIDTGSKVITLSYGMNGD